MKRNPYRWQQDNPIDVLDRAAFTDKLRAIIDRGAAVRLVGGRGMGKTVALRQLERRLSMEPRTKAVLIPAPPAVDTVADHIKDLATRVGVSALRRASLEELIESAEGLDIHRIVVLIDEIDQYLGSNRQQLTLQWLNLLESTRKTWSDRFGVLVAGGLGTLHLGHVLGSGLISRAETVITQPFDLEELRDLAKPLETNTTRLNDSDVRLLMELSGGNPALVTYAMEQLWASGEPARTQLEMIFVEFAARHRAFLESVHEGVSRQGFVGAPGRVLEVIRRGSGTHTQEQLKNACNGDSPPVDHVQALLILEAAGLITVTGPKLARTIQARIVPSILNMATTSAAGETTTLRLVRDVAQALGQLHRFGRDFYNGDKLLPEDTFSSMLAVSLGLRGWSNIARESVQAAGYVDIRIPIEASKHVVLESKIWPRNDIDKAQEQVMDYWVHDTVHAIVVVIGDRKPMGWASDYEAKCLVGRDYHRLDTPADLEGHWQLRETDSKGIVRMTDHLLVQIPKRR
jgi:hypothetical protein